MAIPITLRKKIADFDPIREGITVQQFCKNIGVSKQTYYNIKARIAERGRAGIVPDSTAPLNPRRVYVDKLRQQVLCLLAAVPHSLRLSSMVPKTQ